MTRVALVTGATRGIGLGLACRLAKEGYSVALTYRSRSDLAKVITDQIKADGHHALAIQMSVENRSSVRQALGLINKHFGSVDVLVNNAAIAQEKPFETITDQDWDEMMGVNLRGPFVCSQECLPNMVEQGWGRVINVSSIGGQWGGINQVHYAASKAGLINLTRSLARLYSGSGVTTNALAIGLVSTDMSATELATEAGQAKVRAIPRGRIGTVRDIADAVTFLASDQSDYVTGQTININGGMYFG